MIKLIASMLLCFALTSCASANWSKGDTLREIAWGVVHTVDWGQTLEIARHPDQYYEMNPIMQRHPSVGTVNLYMGSSMILHPIVSYALPKELRIIWQYLTIGTSSVCVINNYMIGLRMKF